jgi:hypothetical protein
MQNAPAEDALPGESWPPIDGQRFIRSDDFGGRLLALAQRLARHFPDGDFAYGAAQVFAWFDRTLKRNRRFINARRFRTRARFDAYVHAMLKNAARLAHRREEHAPYLEEMPAAPPIAAGGPPPEVAADLRERIAALPPLPRRVLWLLLFEEESDVVSVARELGIPVRRVRRLFEKALDLLRGPPS